MLEGLSLLKEIYNQAPQELQAPKRHPLIFSQTAMNILLEAYEKETGEALKPDENGVYKMYGYDVVIFDKWDEKNLTC